MPSSMAAVAASRGTSASGFSSTSSSPKRSTRRAMTASVRSSQASSSARTSCAAKYSSRVLFRQRRGQLDARLALAIIEIDRHDEFLARDGFGAREHGATTIGELVAARHRPRAGARCDPGRPAPAARRPRTSGTLRVSAPSCCSKERCARRTRSSVPRSTLPPRCSASRRVRMSLSRGPPPARSRSRSESSAASSAPSDAAPSSRDFEQHVREARMRREIPAWRGRAASPCQPRRARRDASAGRARSRAWPRAADPASAACRPRCPRPRGPAPAAPGPRRRPPAVRRPRDCVRAPSPHSRIADAGRGAAGAAGALLGGRARDALQFEPIHAARRIEQAAPLEPGVDDDAHAVDGQAGLGDVGGEHDLAAPGLRRLQRGVLLAGGKLAVQWQHVCRTRRRPACPARDGSRRRRAGTPACRPRPRSARA